MQNGVERHRSSAEVFPESFGNEASDSGRPDQERPARDHHPGAQGRGEMRSSNMIHLHDRWPAAIPRVAFAGDHKRANYLYF
jgi:hypothetical protein